LPIVIECVLIEKFIEFIENIIYRIYRKIAVDKYLSILSNLSKKLSKFIKFIEKLFFDKWTLHTLNRQRGGNKKTGTEN
jgi:hypothetical protein